MQRSHVASMRLGREARCLRNAVHSEQHAVLCRTRLLRHATGTAQRRVQTAVREVIENPRGALKLPACHYAYKMLFIQFCAPGKAAKSA